MLRPTASHSGPPRSGTNTDIQLILFITITIIVFFAALEAGGTVHKLYSMTATVGLVVHAAADGIALGAASGTDTDIQLILFITITIIVFFAALEAGGTVHKLYSMTGLVVHVAADGIALWAASGTNTDIQLILFITITIIVFFAALEAGGTVHKLYSMTATVGLVVHAAADGIALGAASGTDTDIQLILFIAITIIVFAALEAGGTVHKRYSMTATVGLVVHAAADGIALGAASGTQADIQLILFVAIMLHKAPAAFGLVTFLLHEGLDKARVRRHLLVFSLAAPILALLTYLLINQSSYLTLSTARTTGALMLFSAGTFLYVATVHVLPELTSPGHSHSGDPTSGGGLTLTELAAIITGAVMPTFMAVGHSH